MFRNKLETLSIANPLKRSWLQQYGVLETRSTSVAEWWLLFSVKRKFWLELKMTLADVAERRRSHPWLCYRFTAWLLARHLMSLCPCTCNWGHAWIVHFKSSYLRGASFLIVLSYNATLNNLCCNKNYIFRNLTLSLHLPASLSLLLLYEDERQWNFVSGYVLPLNGRYFFTPATCHIAVRLTGSIQWWQQAGQGCQSISEQGWGGI